MPARMSPPVWVPCKEGSNHRFSETGVCRKCGLVNDEVWIQTRVTTSAKSKPPVRKPKPSDITNGCFHEMDGSGTCSKCGFRMIHWDGNPQETPKKKVRLQIRDGSGCFYCKRDFPLIMLTLDHIIPRFRGGSNADSNCVLACTKCNGEKDNLLLKDWINRWYEKNCIPKGTSYHKFSPVGPMLNECVDCGKQHLVRIYG